MSRTTRKFNRKYLESLDTIHSDAALWGSWWADRLIKKYGSLDNAIKRKNALLAADHHPGTHNAPAHYRRTINRVYRAKANQTLKKIFADNRFMDEDIVIHNQKPDMNYTWF